MKTNVIGSIQLTWNEKGEILHDFHSNVPANDYQRADALALGNVLFTGSQLGILQPRYSLKVCDSILKFLGGESPKPEPIHDPLFGGRIDLVHKGKTIVCTFHPDIRGSGTMEVDEAVSRLLGNLPGYVCNHLVADIEGFLRVGLLLVMNYYLVIMLPTGISKGFFSSRKFKQRKAQFAMLDFNESIYPRWKLGLNAAPENFNDMLEESRRYQDKMKEEFIV